MQSTEDRITVLISKLSLSLIQFKRIQYGKIQFERIQFEKIQFWKIQCRKIQFGKIQFGVLWCQKSSATGGWLQISQVPDTLESQMILNLTGPGCNCTILSRGIHIPAGSTIWNLESEMRRFVQVHPPDRTSLLASSSDLFLDLLLILYL